DIQHDCYNSKCSSVTQKYIQQERLETSKTASIIQHNDTPNYLLNAYSIHNYTHIQAIIPESLREIPCRVLSEDIANVHSKAARQVGEKK
ncbi:hypothetical protein EV424DRAFT_1274269, partial [Suillus variegatus]